MIIKKNTKYGISEIIIDDEDYDKIKDYNLQINRSPSSCSVFYYTKNNNGEYKRNILHRVLIDCPDGLFVDHINHNPLDNRKQNLRICTKQENLRNRRKPKNYNNTYKGVRQEKKYHKFILTFSFDSELDAKNEYNYLAKKYHKEFACLNP
jgi:hypothetical protein